MFTSSKPNKSYRDSFSHRASKATSKKKGSSFKDKDLSQHSRRISVQQPPHSSPRSQGTSSSPTSPHLNSAIITISIGPAQRLFAAHEDVLSKSSHFSHHLRAQFFESAGKRIDLPAEEPEVFSAVLEYLYKGDYTPKLAFDKKRGSWYLEDHDPSAGESTVAVGGDGSVVLKDTVIYCAAFRYGLPELQRLALKKQGLQSGVQCSTILSSARFAYANTPASDSKLRAHYLALVIRSRNTFKRSGTMQMEMQRGGSPLFFDLFVAMVNHLDDITKSSR
ncbi:uncharacterized protein LTR77_004266 [Saxophila tyrrhenica]|uniref:BTB domain-containing protein n=1 Tax=Saxophila tyrrhenica TaxID=1690608 RepID=A0AAV9PCB2_9PEZI|nr:hypothetical protein LTR77_004266 [Saxophila tyrrhenica]